MLEINYMGFTIRIKYLSTYKEWLVGTLDSTEKIIVSNRLPTHQQAEGWSKYMIENLVGIEE